MSKYLGLKDKGNLTIRDYFAAKMMSSLYESLTSMGEDGPDTSESDRVAKICYKIADSMLKARSK